MSEVGSLRVGAEAEESRHIAPETRLFLHIILVAIQDAIHGARLGRPAEDRRVQTDALNWFVRADDDFRTVCECAELDPGDVQRKALSFIYGARKAPKGRRASLRSKVAGPIRPDKLAA